MAAALEPPRLAELFDLAERPRVDGWSLRAALCRYAQPQPVRAGALLTVLRRIESAMGEHTAELRADGADLVARSEAVRSGAADAEDTSAQWPLLVDLLVLAAELDDVGTIVAGWAVDRSGERPDHEIDEVTANVTARLADLGVPEETPPPRGMRGRG